MCLTYFVSVCVSLTRSEACVEVSGDSRATARVRGWVQLSVRAKITESKSRVSLLLWLWVFDMMNEWVDECGHEYQHVSGIQPTVIFVNWVCFAPPLPSFPY
jgi:hypothetical protein